MNYGTEYRGKSIYWPRIHEQILFYGVWQHNYYFQQRQACRGNEWSTYLDVYGHNHCPRFGTLLMEYHCSATLHSDLNITKLVISSTYFITQT